LRENLRTIVGIAYSETTDTEITVVCETAGCYIFEDPTHVLRDALATECDIEGSAEVELITKMHQQVALQHGDDSSFQQPELASVFYVEKEPSWYDAHWAVDRLFTNLLNRGLSPTQALDYWMVSVLGKQAVEWAKIRGTTGQAIRNSVNKAEKNLSAKANPPDAPTYTPLEKTYRGQVEDGKKKVTVDGHFLYPRLDVAEYARSGKFDWERRTPKSKQLAVALLYDVLETNNILPDIIDEFAKFLTTLDSEWTLTAEEIRGWVYTETELLASLGAKPPSSRNDHGK
jgi:hypothetical protein